MKKNKLKIGDVARQLGIKKSIIRQWEQEFNLKVNDSYYSNEDIQLFTTIKDLLRTKGFSLSDVKAQLKTTVPAIKYVESQIEQEVAASASEPTPAPLEAQEEKAMPVSQEPLEIIPQMAAAAPEPAKEEDTHIRAAELTPEPEENELTSTSLPLEQSCPSHIPASSTPQIPSDLLEALSTLKSKLLEFKDFLK